MAKAAAKPQNERATTFSEAFSSFSVNDIKKAKTFYTDTLSLKVKSTQEGLELEFEDSDSVFIYPKDDHEPASFTVLNFKVPDIDAAVNDLGSRGIVFEKYGGDIKTDEKGIFRGREKADGPNIAWFKGSRREHTFAYRGVVLSYALHEGAYPVFRGNNN